jgi:outer membrane immunogenic protein
MKSVFIGGVALLAFLAGNSAFAQDRARSSPQYSAMPVTVYNWNGFYAGANLGGSFGGSSADVSFAGTAFAPTSQRMDGVLGGLQAGYNWQSGRALFGAETDIQATGQKGSSSLTNFIPGTPTIPGTPAIPCIQFDPPAPACIVGTGIPATPDIPGTPATTSVVNYQNKLPWFGTLRGRLGYTPAERWLVYATGGLAYGEVTTIETLNVNGAGVVLSSTALKVGWTAGLGVEAIIANGWTVKFEYLFIDFGNVNNALIGIVPITAVARPSHVTDNIVRVGFNYQFGRAPIIVR